MTQMCAAPRKDRQGELTGRSVWLPVDRDRKEVTRSLANTLVGMAKPPHRQALHRALVATLIAILAALSYPMALWWADHADEGWWGIAIYVGLGVAALVYVVAPIALVVAIFWYVVSSWRFARRALPQ